MSATFWNMRRRLAAEKAAKIKAAEEAKEAAEKPKKGKVKKNG